MKEQRNRYSKLEEENKDLKLSLKKVSAHQSFQSGTGGDIVNGLQSMESSIKSNMSGYSRSMTESGNKLLGMLVSRLVCMSLNIMWLYLNSIHKHKSIQPCVNNYI